MIEIWGYELLRGLIKFFLNPLLYWSFFLLLVISKIRIKNERRNFASKIYPLFSEMKNTWIISIVFGIVFSVLSVIIGMSLSLEIYYMIVIVTIILTVFGSLSMLTPSLTIGITYFSLLILPLLPLSFLESYFTFSLPSSQILTNVAIFMAIMLLAEAFLIRRNRKDTTYPTLIQSQRGIWVGEQHVKKLTIIPLLMLVPTNGIDGVLPIFPLIEVSNQSYQLILFPFVIGFHIYFQGELPIKMIRKYFQSVLILAFIVLLLAIASIYIPILSFLSVIFAIIGRGFIKYRYMLNDQRKPPYFTLLNRGIRVLAVKPDGPADRLGISVGETIVKVNDELVKNSNQFYEALQNSGAFFKLEVLDIYGEVRFVTSAFFEEDHYELGLSFPEAPYRHNRGK